MKHYNISIYEIGDIVRFKDGWRSWNKGDLAKVKDYRFEKCDDITTWQLLELEPVRISYTINSDDRFYIYAYCVEWI